MLEGTLFTRTSLFSPRNDSCLAAGNAHVQKGKLPNGSTVSLAVFLLGRFSHLLPLKHSDLISSSHVPFQSVTRRGGLEARTCACSFNQRPASLTQQPEHRVSVVREATKIRLSGYLCLAPEHCSRQEVAGAYSYKAHQRLWSAARL